MRATRLLFCVLLVGACAETPLDEDPTLPPILGGGGDRLDNGAPLPGTGPQTGGVPWNGASWEGMPWDQSPLESIGVAGFAPDGSVELNLGNSNGLQNTADGRAVLKYLAQCALPGGSTLRFTVDGSDYAYPGLLGLAPYWTSRALSAEEQRWVSACILASVNAGGYHVPFSPRGDHQSLLERLTPEELQAFSYEEAAFYGNIFASEPYVCVGRDLVQSEAANNPEGFSLEVYLNYRLCSISDSCGFQRTGHCYSLTGRRTCDSHPDDLSSNVNCYDRDVKPPASNSGTLFVEVITAYITPSDADEMRSRAVRALVFE